MKNMKRDIKASRDGRRGEVRVGVAPSEEGAGAAPLGVVGLLASVIAHL